MEPDRGRAGAAVERERERPARLNFPSLSLVGDEEDLRLPLAKRVHQGEDARPGHVREGSPPDGNLAAGLHGLNPEELAPLFLGFPDVPCFLLFGLPSLLCHLGPSFFRDCTFARAGSKSYRFPAA